MQKVDLRKFLEMRNKTLFDSFIAFAMFIVMFVPERHEWEAA